MKLSVFVLILICFAAALAAYWPAVGGDFIWDDDQYVEHNQTLRDVDGLEQIWFEVGATPQYYPLVFTSFWIEYHLWELNTAGYHLINITFHSLAALLLWRVLVLLRIPGAWAAAVIFLLHPVHVESVAWISERKNVLSGVFYLATALLYLKFTLDDWADTPRWKVASHYWLAIILFACALLSKTVTCTLPVALLLILWWKTGTVSRRHLIHVAPMFLLGLAFGLLTVYVEKHHVGANTPSSNTWPSSVIERCLIADQVIWFYIGKLFYPANLTFIYPRWTINSSNLLQYIAPVTTIFSMTALWFTRRVITAGPFVAMLFFVISLAPALGFINYYPMRFSYVADHFQYLASIGPITLASAIIFTAINKWSKYSNHAMVLITTLACISCAIITWNQCQMYENRQVLWQTTINKNPDAWIGHHNLANILLKQQATNQAIEHYRTAIRLNPEPAISHHNLAGALLTVNNISEAEKEYLLALEYEPEFVSAHISLSQIYFANSDLINAKKHFEQATSINSDLLNQYNEFHTLLTRKIQSEAARLSQSGQSAIQLGDLKLAADYYEQATLLKPYSADDHAWYGAVLSELDRTNDAIVQYELALKYNTDCVVALNGLAWILATHDDDRCQHSQRAIDLAKRASDLTRHQNANILDTLAAAYASSENFEMAIEVAKQALDLSDSSNDIQAEQTYEIKNRLERYQKRQADILSQ